MGEIRKGAAGAATPDNAQNVGQMGNTGHQEIISKGFPAVKLFSILPEGRENAVPMRVLAERLGVDDRALRAAIMRARESGDIIAGDSAGYYIPTDKAELRRYYHTARKRCLSGLRALQAARRKLEELEGE